jgi:hypothetical protein
MPGPLLRMIVEGIAMESVQQIQEMEQCPTQLSRLAENLGERVSHLFDDTISILAAIVAHDNRWDL